MPDNPARQRPRWTSAQFSLVAFAFNGLALIVLIANLVTGSTWWQFALVVGVICLALGGAAAVRARLLRLRERQPRR